MKVVMLTREYPPHIYGGAGVVVGELTRALSRRMGVEVRCFGERPPPSGDDVVVRGYTSWERLEAGPDGPAFAPALETLSIGLAMARDPVDADVAHAHTWYAAMAGCGSGYLTMPPTEAVPTRLLSPVSTKSGGGTVSACCWRESQEPQS